MIIIKLIRGEKLLLILLLFSGACFGQDVATTSQGPGTISSGTIKWGPPIFGGAMGHFPVQEFDTVKAVLLITECDDCPSKSMSAFAIRQKYVYLGDPMPPGDYSPRWQVISFLNIRKKTFPLSTIIWYSQLK